jgi:glutathione peroxidase
MPIPSTKGADMTDLNNIPLKRIDGGDDTLAAHAGKVLLVVNVASKCGLTPQYAQLEALFQEKQAQGLEVLGFPANDFMGQEPGSDADISTFCSLNYDVSFPLYSKIAVLGDDQHPLYATLTAARPETTGDGPFREKLKEYGVHPARKEDVLWNFEKFLIGRNGEVAGRFAPDVTADDPRLLAAIDAELAKPGA